MAMLEGVAAFLDSHESELNGNPVIAGVARKLALNLKHIRKLKHVQDRKTKVASQAKDELKTALIEDILKVGAALRAYATESRHFELLALATFSDSKIKRMRHNDLAGKAKTIYETAAPLAGQLMIYLVEPEDVSRLETNVAAYLHALPGRRTIQIQTKQATAKINVTVNKSLQLVKEKLDVHMRPHKAANAGLHREYMNARIIASKVMKQEGRQTAKTKATEMRGSEVWSVD